MGRRKKDPVIARLKTTADWNKYFVTVYDLAEEVRPSKKEVGQDAFLDKDTGAVQSIEDIASAYGVVNREDYDGLQPETSLREAAANESFILSDKDQRDLAVLAVIFGILSRKGSMANPRGAMRYALECVRTRTLFDVPPELGTAEELKAHDANGNVVVLLHWIDRSNYGIEVIDYTAAYEAAMKHATEEYDEEDAADAAAEAAAWRYDEADFGPASEPWGS
jgi:hypothetical protein